MFDLLSERQNEVVNLVSKGLSNKEVGVQLGVSEKTVKFHLTGIYKKLGVKSRMQLAVLKATRIPFLNGESNE